MVSLEQHPADEPPPRAGAVPAPDAPAGASGTNHPGPEGSTAADHRQQRIELLATILLAAAAVATAWSTYQSAIWRGEQAKDSNAATAAHIASSEASTRAGQLVQIDVLTFAEWLDADVAGDEQLAGFYRERFRDEFRPAFDAWLATDPRENPDAPSTPFAMSEYVVANAVEAERLYDEADVQTRRSHQALERSDDYMLAVVLFAMSLFFAALSTKFHTPRREILVGIGGVIFLGAAGWIAVLAFADPF
jgi:hypothetical protein